MLSLSWRLKHKMNNQFNISPSNCFCDGVEMKNEIRDMHIIGNLSPLGLNRFTLSLMKSRSAPCFQFKEKSLSQVGYKPKMKAGILRTHCFEFNRNLHLFCDYLKSQHILQPTTGVGNVGLFRVH